MTNEELILMRKAYGNHFDNFCNQEQLLEAYKREQGMTNEERALELWNKLILNSQKIQGGYDDRDTESPVDILFKALNAAERKGMERAAEIVNLSRDCPPNMTMGDYIEQAIRDELKKIGE